MCIRDRPEASIGDYCVIYGAGAYASAMTPKHYNSYPEAAEVILDASGSARLIRRRQELEDIWANEVQHQRVLLMLDLPLLFFKH